MFRNFLVLQLISLIWCSLAMAENYKCKFSARGAQAESEFNGSAPLQGFHVGDFDFSVIRTTVKTSETPANEIIGIAIVVTGGGLKTIAVAPMGTPFIGTKNETFGVQGSCRLH